MGVNVDLTVGNLSLWYWKSFFDRGILGLFFTDDDLKITEDVKYDESDVDEIPHTQYRYSTTVRNAIQRLDSIGYTLKSAQTDFDLYKYDCLDYRSLLYNLGVDYDSYDEIKKQRIDKYVTFRKWKNAVLKYAYYEATHGAIPLFREDETPNRCNCKCLYLNVQGSFELPCCYF